MDTTYHQDRIAIKYYSSKEMDNFKWILNTEHCRVGLVKNKKAEIAYLQ